MFNWVDIKELEVRRQDMMREAELDRLARQARPHLHNPTARTRRPRLAIRYLSIAKSLGLISG